jgi:hypothetical protein
MKRKNQTNKGILYTLFLLLFVFIIPVSCSKSSNSVSIIAPVNPVKTVSSVGPASTGGSLVYYGNNALPDSTVGCLGDFYLCVSQGVLYGPKTLYSWGNTHTLTGATAAENQVYSGTQDPVNDLGLVGDYYLNTKTFVLYGPKSSSGWNNSLDLQGSGQVKN